MGVAIATFTQPIHGTATKDSLPRIAIAATVDDDGDVQLLVIDGDGKMEMLAVSYWDPQFNVGLRYDMRSETWVDVSSGSTDDEEDE